MVRFFLLLIFPCIVFAHLDEKAYEESFSETIYEWEASSELLNKTFPPELYIDNLNSAICCCRRVINNCDRIIYDISKQHKSYIYKNKWPLEMAIKCNTTRKEFLTKIRKLRMGRLFLLPKLFGIFYRKQCKYILGIIIGDST